jgi:K+-sensing histidine kinase KdpD
MDNLEELKKEIERLNKLLSEKEGIIHNLMSCLHSFDLRFNIFHVLGKMLTTGFELEKLLDETMDMIINTINVEAASLLLFNEEEKVLEFKIAKGEKANEIKKYTLLPNEGVAGYVYTTGESIIVHEPEKETRLKREIIDAIGFTIRNMLCVPLKFENKIIGVIELINKLQRKFIKEDLDTINSIVGEISLVIEYVRLFKKNQQKIDLLTSLMEISSAINSSLDLKEVLNKIMQYATKLLNAQTSSVYLIDKDKNELFIIVATGEPGEKVKELRFPISVGIAGWVAQHGESLIINDVQNDYRYYKEVEKITKLQINSMIAVPLITKDKIIGVIEVMNKLNKKPFTKEDLNILELFSYSCAIAIDNAITHEEVIKEQERVIQTEKFALIGKLASSIMHQLRTPFAIINTSVQSALKYISDDKIKTKLETIQRNIQRANDIIKNLLKIDISEFKLNDIVQINEILDKVISIVKDKCNEEGIEVVQNYSYDLPKVKCDRGYLEHAFLNFIINSIEATPKGGKIIVSIEKEEDKLKIQIEDTGRGIEPETLSKLFTPFFTTKEEGVGLGMFTSKRIIELHNGKINIESELQKGTKVIVFLPIY